MIEERKKHHTQMFTCPRTRRTEEKMASEKGCPVVRAHAPKSRRLDSQSSARTRGAGVWSGCVREATNQYVSLPLMFFALPLPLSLFHSL